VKAGQGIFPEGRFRDNNQEEHPHACHREDDGEGKRHCHLSSGGAQLRQRGILQIDIVPSNLAEKESNPLSLFLDQGNNGKHSTIFP
jgi:hypothetical protein